ncbi:Gfo/Idh/MocA family oxidoreductase [Candidatus Poribacteria bacterium]|nr:Gfo/Idh/MocA family oxidoreductase [Candidatus Poribacteria bacterium]
MADRTWRIAGINFDHMHMGDNLGMAHEHPRVDIVGVSDEDPARMQSSIETFGIPEDRVFTDYLECMEKAKPDIVLLCPATAHHGEWTEKIAPYGVHVIMEKPFAGSLAEADRMIAAMQASGKTLAINWPLRWYPPHVTSKRLVDEGAIGDVVEVHYYDGNRGPLFHMADKVETDDAFRDAKNESWFYQKDAGGGSLLDYLGYGVTLGTWYHGGKAPTEVTAVTDDPTGLEVDEHSITIAKYDVGLSKYETRWGTFTDPWTLQPQPKCGFVIKGTEGTITSYDYEQTIRVQTDEHPEGRELPVDVLAPPNQDPVQYVIHCLETGRKLDGPLSPETCRIGQQIVDTAARSAAEQRTMPLVG